MLTPTSAKMERRRDLMADRGTSTTASPSTSATNSLPSSIPSSRRMPAGMTTRPFGPTATTTVSLMNSLCHPTSSEPGASAAIHMPIEVRPFFDVASP